MKKGEATHLHQIKKKATVLDDGVIVLGNDGTKEKAVRTKVKTPTPDPGTTKGRLGREKIQIIALPKATARNPVMPSVLGIHRLKEDRLTDRTKKKPEGLPTAAATKIAPVIGEMDLKAGRVQVAVAAENTQATNSPNPGPRERRRQRRTGQPVRKARRPNLPRSPQRTTRT
jgi:hypothetical protein